MPQRVEALSGRQVRFVAAGDDSSSTVTAAGEFFTWGIGQFGLVGHGNTANQLVPKRVEAL